VETNKNIQWNLGTFNVPTLVGLLGIGVMVFNAGQNIQAQESRITSIENSRAERGVTFSKVTDITTANTSAIANLVYRMTVAEQGIVAVNARVDRQTDALQDFQKELAKVNTNIELLTQQIKLLLPEKKAELDHAPPEFASR
jgi:hypothetical protein